MITREAFNTEIIKLSALSGIDPKSEEIEGLWNLFKNRDIFLLKFCISGGMENWEFEKKNKRHRNS